MAKYYTEEENKKWRESQPKKLIGAKVVIKSAEGTVLLVKPTYKPTWQLPGGVVEAGESPEMAVVREVYEEIGLVCDQAHLRLVDIIFRPDEDVILVLYELNMPIDVASEMKLQDSELERFEWVPVNRVAERLPDYYGDFWRRYTE